MLRNASFQLLLPLMREAIGKTEGYPLIQRLKFIEKIGYLSE